MSDQAQRPTQVRHVIITVAMVSSILLYLDRFCTSFADRYIMQDLGLTNDQIGYLFAAFFVTYGIAQVPSGWLCDRFGGRRMLTLYVLLWSLFTGLIGLAGSFAVLLLLRFGLGLAQAGAYPTCASLISKWVPFSNRGFASSVVAFGGRIGGALAPVLTAYLIVLFVPLTTSSLLTPADILDRSVLREQLSDKARSRDGKPLIEQLSEPARNALRADQIDASQASLIADDLSVLVRRPDLERSLNLENVDLPNEAKQIRALPSSERKPHQVERLNRLLLESVFPGGVRKVYVAGWRPVMYWYGGIGIFVAALLWICLRDYPRVHPWCNESERRLIAGGELADEAPARKAGKAPMKAMLQSSSLWMLCIAQVGTNVGWVFLVTWLPRYLDEVHKIPIERRGWLASVPIFVGWFGMLSGGWLTDRLTRSMGRKWGRSIPLFSSRFLAAAAFLACMFPLSPIAVTIAFSIVAFATDLGSPATWAFNQDVGGRYVGSVLGWGNMWGNLGAAVSPPLLNWVVKAGGWDWAFATCAASFITAGIACLFVDAARPVVPADA